MAIDRASILAEGEKAWSQLTQFGQPGLNMTKEQFMNQITTAADGASAKKAALNPAMAAQSSWGAQGQKMAEDSLGRMSGFRNDAAFGAQNDLASLLQQYQNGGNMPTAQDTSRSQAFAQSQFDPQRVAMQQAFADQTTQANRQAALSGRGVNDPILRAKLAQQQTQQSAILNSQQGAFATQYAMQQPKERLGFAEGRANVLTQNMQQRMGLETNIFAQGMAAQGADFAQRFQTQRAERGDAFDDEKLGFVQKQYADQQAAANSPCAKIGGVMKGILGVGGGLMSAGSALGALGGGGGSGGSNNRMSLGTGYMDASNSSGNIFGVGKGA